MNRRQRRAANKQPSSQNKVSPSAPATLFAEAMQHQQAGRFAEAATIYRDIIAIKPDYLDAHINLGYVLEKENRLDEAASCFERVLVLAPNSAEAHNNLGTICMRKGRIEQAAACFGQALVIKPAYAEARNNLGNILLGQHKPEEAFLHFREALTLMPRSPEIYNNLGNALERLGRLDEAAKCYLNAATLKPDYITAYNNLGNVLICMGRLDDAAKCYERALAIFPDSAEAHNNLGNIGMAQHKLAEADTHFKKALALRPDYTSVHYNRTALKTFRPGDADLAALEAMAGGMGRLPEGKKLYIHFALAKALDDVGEYQRAFEHMVQGNAMKRRAIHYNEAANMQRFSDIIRTFTPELFSGFVPADTQPAPVFIIGMPRSGTTLVEQVLASHPQLHGAGEVRSLSAVIHAHGQYPAFVPSLNAEILSKLGKAYMGSLPPLPSGKTRVTDKMPTNFYYAGLIPLMLPNAKIIHITRDAADTCLSCYSKLFTFGYEFAYDLAELGRYYRHYAQLMDHWRSVLPEGAVLEVPYEALVGDFEGQARRMVEYCGLPWDSRCLDFYKTERMVGTASNVQVRQPLFSSSLGRWRHYETYLRPLLAELY